MVIKTSSKKVSKPECLVVKGKVKKIIREAGFRSGGDFLRALSDKIQNIVDGAIQQTKEDGKKLTLGAEDVPV